jgi:hypothetical protein
MVFRRSSLVARDSRISAFSRDEETASNKIVSELKAGIRRYEINWCRTTPKAGSNRSRQILNFLFRLFEFLKKKNT